MNGGDKQWFEEADVVEAVCLRWTHSKNFNDW